MPRKNVTEIGGRTIAALFALVVVILGGIYVIVGIPATTKAVYTPTQTGGACTIGNGLPKEDVLDQYVDYQNGGQLTWVGTEPAALVSNGTVLQNITLGATGASYFANETAVCNKQLSVVTGGNVNFYKVMSPIYTMNTSILTVQSSSAMKMADLAGLSFSNQSLGGGQVFKVKVYGINGIEDVRGLTITLNGGPGDYGNGYIGKTGIFNGSMIDQSKFSIEGCTPYSDVNGKMYAVGTNTLSGGDNPVESEWQCPALAWSASNRNPSETFKLDVSTTNNFIGSNSTEINFAVNDQVLTFKNGQMVPRYIDQNTGLDLGGTELVYGAGVTINTP